MALQLRRGTSSSLTTITPAQGELVYTTDTKRVYVGDGSTAGGNPVSPVTSVNSLTGAVALTTDNIAEGTTAGKEYFTVNRASDAAGAMIAAGTLSGLTVSYNSTTHAITITNTNVIQSGTTNSIGYWASNGTTLSPSQNLTWDETANVLQNINGQIIVTANNGPRSLISAQTFNNLSTGGNSFSIVRARGTNVSPTAVVSADTVGFLNFVAYDGSKYGTTASIGSTVSANPVSGSGVIQGNLVFTATNSSGQSQIVARMNNNGFLAIGPAVAGDTGSGYAGITSTVTNNGGFTLRLGNIYSDSYGPTLEFRKYRGAYGSSTVVNTGDNLAVITGKGYDGANLQVGASISLTADSTVSTGIVPGAIIFSTANSAGALTQAVKIDHTQLSTFSSNVVINGTLTVNGTTTTVNTNTVNVENKNINLGYLTSGVVSTTGTVGSITGTGPWTATITGMSSTNDLIVGSAITATAGAGTLGSGGTYIVASIVSSTSITYTATGGTTPTAGTVTNISTTGYTDVTANGGGILLYGATNKTFEWSSTNSAWTSSEHISLATGKSYEINGASVLNATTLGTGVTGSSLQSVGTITSGTWQGTVVGATYGGTGVNNGSYTITLAGNVNHAGAFTTSGAYPITLSATASTSVTLPTSGTLVNNLVTTLSSLTSIGTLGSLTVSGTSTLGTVATTGLTLRSVNFITVASTGTYVLSTTVSYNVLVVGSTGLTVTVTLPASPVDQQLVSFTVASNTISTLNMTAGPTVVPAFNGTTNVVSGTVYQYVYRASNSTWYRN